MSSSSTERDPSATPAAHALSAEAVAASLHVRPAEGLATHDVEARLRRHGHNSLPEAAPRSWLLRLVDQFRDFMILVLLAAGVLSGMIGDIVDTVAILVILVLNAAIGMVQEWRADHAMQALRQLAVPHARVRRNGQTEVIETRHLVPGDVVLLEAGDMVPADLRLIDAAQLLVDESALTGESVTVQKHTDLITEGASLPLGDRLNMAFKGTLISHGRGTGLVVATGERSELGRIAALMQTAGDHSTPLQRRLAAFGKRLSLVVLAICAVIFTTGVLRGEPIVLMALTAISLAVAAIPEALPAVVTVLLALGARTMARHNALVRRLPAVETLGSVTTICSDKTGTLTLNRMQVQEWQTWGGLPASTLWETAALCNDAAPAQTDGQWQGDPTETALVEQAQADGVDVRALRLRLPRQSELPFDAERKRMTTVHHGTDAARWLGCTKGAPESVLPLCGQQQTAHGPQPIDTQAVLGVAQAMGTRGMRVLAVAQRSWDVAPTVDSLEADLTLIGLIGLLDPPRADARQSVTQCLTAGITPVMITGDHPATALAIARELGIAGEHDRVLTGAELAALDDAALAAVVPDVRVYARTDPAQKIRIVQALQKHGQCVAMTGDGVNDAPALRAADIGVAMGMGGTDVAREAASLVLLDDHFGTIVSAVREGRRIYDNIRKFVRYTMTGNSGEIWTLFLAPLLGLPVPLLPIHILWINLVTDGLPGLALAAEPAERTVMLRPPRQPDEGVFAHGLWQHALWVGLLIGGLCLGVQAWAHAHGNPHAQTLVFVVLTFTQMAHVLAIRSERDSLFTLGLRSNLPLLGAVALTFALQLMVVYLPVLQGVFHTEALSLREMALSLGCAAAVFGSVELEKAWQRRTSTRPPLPQV
ncbi:MAG: cation-translocating P-type ATPase [Thiomonas sp.]